MEFNAIVLVMCVTSLLVVELLAYAYRAVRYPHRRKVQRRLKTVRAVQDGQADPDILRNRPLSQVPFLNAVLSSVPFARRLDNLVLQANSDLPLGFFILFSLVLVLGGYVMGGMITHRFSYAVGIGVLLAPLPFLYLRRKKRRRMEKMERQLPDGLDLISRALKAGHAFTSGMQLAADEMTDPFGTALQETIDEINFGISVQDALKNLAHRYDCPDLKFFVVAAVIQREAGGNLVEIMEGLSRIIRERFKLYGKIRTLSAEGRMSARVLVAIPLFVLVAILFLNPGYAKILFDETTGQVLLAIGAAMMITGILVMRRIIAIKV